MRTTSDARYPLEFLYDGHCPICCFDVAWLARRDRHQRLRFIDVRAPGFDPAPYGRSLEALLERIAGRRADGQIVEGAEVFRLVWSAIGFGWLVVPTRWPGLRQLAEAAYRLFARHRLTLSRRFGGFFARLTPACDSGSGVCAMRRPS
ncbi:MAG: DUF393 domain-containing protein [Zoogloeaceae bacterium]|jgi:predicted DCC family thiol-disulfide oxidoreductase YuxK|nr:DUF393 domain-containing protein [Zoogloeaceae bacterium]